MADRAKRALQEQRMIVGRGLLTRAADGGATLQLELLADEVLDDLQRHQDYGLVSNPLPGAEAVTVALGGGRGRSLVVVVSDARYRIELEPGEVALVDDLGQKVHLTRDGIVIETAKSLTIQTGEGLSVNATGDVTVNTDGKASVTAGGDVEVEAGGEAKVTGTSKATVTAPQVIVDSGDIRLGGAGATKKVALVGDLVSSGVITGPGATKVKAL